MKEGLMTGLQASREEHAGCTDRAQARLHAMGVHVEPHLTNARLKQGWKYKDFDGEVMYQWEVMLPDLPEHLRDVPLRSYATHVYRVRACCPAAALRKAYIELRREIQPTLEEYGAQLRNHDWFYAYTDDHRVWRAGEREQSRLIALAKEYGAEFQRCYNAHLQVCCKTEAVAFPDAGVFPADVKAVKEALSLKLGTLRSIG